MPQCLDATVFRLDNILTQQYTDVTMHRCDIYQNVPQVQLVFKLLTIDSCKNTGIIKAHAFYWSTIESRAHFLNPLKLVLNKKYFT